MTKISNQYSLTNILTADLANSRLGINNVSPTVALDVTGAGKFSGVLTLGSTISNGTNTYTLPSATGTLALTSALSGTTNYVPKFTSASTVGNSLVFDSGTNVGVGTATPLSKLDVRDASAVMGNYQTIQAFSTDSAGINLGAGISLGGFYSGTSLIAQFGSIVGKKENSTSGNYNGYLAFGTNNQATGVVERMRLDSSGNLGLGVTPSAWDTSSYKVIESGDANNQSALGFRTDTNGIELFSNAYFNGTNSIYKYTGLASLYQNTNGIHEWYNAPSGTAGNAISWTQAMTITSAGNVGIGTSSPNSGLHISSGDTRGLRIDVNSGVSGFSMSPNGVFGIDEPGVGNGRFVINTSGNVGIGTTSPARGLSLFNNTIGLYNSATGQGGTSGYTMELSGTTAYLWNYENDSLIFGTNNTERMRITSGGNVLIGKTNDTTSAETIVGLQITTGARILCTVDGTYSAFSRLNSDGDLITFHRGTTTKVGSISVTTSATAYNTSSDYRLKEDLKGIKGLEKVSAIKVYDFKWKSSNDRMDGVLAHELQEVLPYAVTGIKDGEDMQGVDYSKIVPVMLKAIQELSAKVSLLENK